MIGPEQFDPFWYAVTLAGIVWVVCVLTCIATYIEKKNKE